MEKRIEKILIALFLVVIMLYGFVYNKGYRYVDEIVDSVVADVKTENGRVRDEYGEGNAVPSFAAISAHLNANLPFKQDMVNINGVIAKNLGLREIYRNSGGVVLDNGYIAGIYSCTSTDYEIEQIKGLKEFLDARDIDLLYVNEPTKYFDDQYIEENLGLNTYVNNNADRFLKRLNEAGINYIDLREHFSEEDSFDYFYKTDHHWTVPAGKEAAEIIMKELNDEYGYDIDLSLYADDNFTVTEYKDVWLGEQGRKFGASYVGYDDYIAITPKYSTSFGMSKDNEVVSGSFEEVLMDKSLYLPEKNVNKAEAYSWHYSYLGNIGAVQNNNIVNGKKILVIGDSFAEVTNTFLALGASEMKGIVMRTYKGSIRDYIDKTDYDIVIVAYVQTMLGAHDVVGSDNYRMFDFE